MNRIKTQTKILLQRSQMWVLDSIIISTINQILLLINLHNNFYSMLPNNKKNKINLINRISSTNILLVLITMQQPQHLTITIWILINRILHNSSNHKFKWTHKINRINHCPTTIWWINNLISFKINNRFINHWFNKQYFNKYNKELFKIIPIHHLISNNYSISSKCIKINIFNSINS